MASLALNSTRSSSPTFFRALFAASSWSLLPGLSLKWSSTLDRLLELFPPFLLAVPKKKVSHSRKSMRSANKGLHDKRNLVHCPGCGEPKLAHHICPSCYSSLNRAWKTKARSEQADEVGLS